MSAERRITGGVGGGSRPQSQYNPINSAEENELGDRNNRRNVGYAMDNSEFKAMESGFYSNNPGLHQQQQQHQQQPDGSRNPITGYPGDRLRNTGTSRTGGRTNQQNHRSDPPPTYAELQNPAPNMEVNFRRYLTAPWNNNSEIRTGDRELRPLNNSTSSSNSNRQLNRTRTDTLSNNSDTETVEAVDEAAEDTSLPGLRRTSSFVAKKKFMVGSYIILFVGILLAVSGAVLTVLAFHNHFGHISIGQQWSLAGIVLLTIGLCLLLTYTVTAAKNKYWAMNEDIHLDNTSTSGNYSRNLEQSASVYIPTPYSRESRSEPPSGGGGYPRHPVDSGGYYRLAARESPSLIGSLHSSAAASTSQVTETSSIEMDDDTRQSAKPSHPLAYRSDDEVQGGRHIPAPRKLPADTQQHPPAGLSRGAGGDSTDPDGSVYKGKVLRPAPGAPEVHISAKPTRPAPGAPEERPPPATSQGPVQKQQQQIARKIAEERKIAPVPETTGSKKGKTLPPHVTSKTGSTPKSTPQGSRKTAPKGGPGKAAGSAAATNARKTKSQENLGEGEVTVVPAPRPKSMRASSFGKDLDKQAEPANKVMYHDPPGEYREMRPVRPAPRLPETHRMPPKLQPSNTVADAKPKPVARQSKAPKQPPIGDQQYCCIEGATNNAQLCSCAADVNLDNVQHLAACNDVNVNVHRNNIPQTSHPSQPPTGYPKPPKEGAPPAYAEINKIKK